MLPHGETGETWKAVRFFMEHKEVALLDSLLSTRTLDPDKAMFPLHFACAEGDLGTIKKLLEQRSTTAKDRLDVNHSFMDLPVTVRGGVLAGETGDFCCPAAPAPAALLTMRAPLARAGRQRYTGQQHKTTR